MPYEAGSVVAEAELDISKFKQAVGEMEGEAGKIVSSMEKAASGLEKAEAGLEGLRASLEAAKSQMSAAESALASSSNKYSELQSKTDELAESYQKLQRELEAAQAAYGRESAQAAMISDEMERLDQSFQQALDAQEKQEAVVEKNAAAFKKAAAAVNKYQAKISDTEKKISSLQGELATLNDRLVSTLPDASAGLGEANELTEMFSGTLSKLAQTTATSAARSLGTLTAKTLGFNTSSGMGIIAARGLSSVLRMVTQAAGASTLGLGALAAGIAIGAYKLYDYASGAKAARESLEQLNNTAQEWEKNNVTTSYEKSEGMSGQGLTKTDFSPQGRQAGESWLEGLTRVWSDGAKETDAIVKEWTEGFTSESDAIAKKMQDIKATAEKAGVSGVGIYGDLDADMKRLEEIDKTVSDFLKKRQNGKELTPDEKIKLQDLIDEREELVIKYRLEEDGTGGFEEIQKNAEAALSRGENPGKVWADAYASASQGIQAFNDELNKQYDEQYKVISAIEDQGEREAALNDLNKWYNDEAQKGVEKYGETLQKVADDSAVFEEGSQYAETSAQIQELAKAMNSFDGSNAEEINKALEGLDETSVVEMTAALASMEAAGVNLSGDMAEAASAIGTIKELLSGGEQSFGDAFSDLDKLFGSGLDSEVLEINAKLGTEALSEAYDAWAKGEHAEIIGKISAEAPTVETLELDANVTVNDPSGISFTADGEGNLETVTAPSGTAFHATGDGTVNITTPSGGYKFEAAGEGEVNITTPQGGYKFKAEGDGEVNITTPQGGYKFKANGEGTVTVLDPEGEHLFTSKGDGTVEELTLPDGTTFHANGDGTVTVTDPEGNVFHADGTGDVTVTSPEGNVFHADGTGDVTVTSPDGTVFNAHGTGDVDVTDPEGYVFNAHGTGDVTVTTPDGTAFNAHGDGIIEKITIPPETEIPTIKTTLEVEKVSFSPATGAGAEKIQEQAQKSLMFDSTPDGIFSGLTDSYQQQIHRFAEAARTGQQEVLESIGNGVLKEGINPQAFTESAKAISSGLQMIKEGTADADQAQATLDLINDLMAAGEYDPTALTALAEAFQNLPGMEGTVFEGIDASTLGDTLLSSVAALTPDIEAAGASVPEGLAKGMENTQAITGAGQTEANAAIESVANGVGMGSPAQKLVPVGESVAQGVGLGMENVTPIDQAASKISDAITTALSGGDSDASKAGIDFDAGLANGIKAGKSKVIEAAKEVAKAAAKAAKDELGISSPSKVTMEYGRFFDEGFAKGVMGDMPAIDKAVRNALYAEPPRDYTANTSQKGAQAIDYDRLADAVASRPAYFDVNGKRMAAATVTDNSEALTARNKRILAGVGSV